jgi:hypothetical protein
MAIPFNWINDLLQLILDSFRLFKCFQIYFHEWYRIRFLEILIKFIHVFIWLLEWCGTPHLRPAPGSISPLSGPVNAAVSFHRIAYSQRNKFTSSDKVVLMKRLKVLRRTMFRNTLYLIRWGEAEEGGGSRVKH